MAQLRLDAERLGSGSPNIYAVTTGTPEHTAEFCAEFGVPFTCLVDRPGEPAYAAFGLEKVSVRRLLGPDLMETARTVLKRFREIRNPRSGDVHQLSGTFVLDGDGEVRLAHRSEYPNDHLSTDEIRACLDGL